MTKLNPNRARHLALIGAVGASLLVGAFNLGALNPEDEENFNSVTFVNDTEARTRLSLCANESCEELRSTVALGRGEREEDVQVSNHSLEETFLVSSESGDPECLPLAYSRPVDEQILVPLSRARRCTGR
jgi:hypothetical protein